MEFQEFNQKVRMFIEKLKGQGALAIIRFGSSLHPEDYLPGISDLDMVVLSNDPIEDTTNDLGFEYFFDEPRSFIVNFFSGNPFAMAAIEHGQVVYDPNGFVECLHTLATKGIAVGPNEYTRYICVQAIANQLSSAINRYFRPDDEEGAVAKLLRNVHNTMKALSVYWILDRSGKLTGGYTETVTAIRDLNSQLYGLLSSTRQRLVDHQEMSPVRKSQTMIANDELGDMVLLAETAYLNSDLPFVQSKTSTNRLIERSVSQQGEFEKIEAVRINNMEFSHLVLGTQGDSHLVFGTVKTNSAHPEEVYKTIDSNEWEIVFNELGLLR